MVSEVLELFVPDQHNFFPAVAGKVAIASITPVTEEKGASDYRIKGKNVVCGD